MYFEVLIFAKDLLFLCHGGFCSSAELFFIWRETFEYVLCGYCASVWYPPHVSDFQHVFSRDWALEADRDGTSSALWHFNYKWPGSPEPEDAAEETQLVALQEIKNVHVILIVWCYTWRCLFLAVVTSTASQWLVQKFIVWIREPCFFQLLHVVHGPVWTA